MLRHEWALKSAPGQGATFSIRVPRGEAVVEEGEGGSAPRSDRSMRGLKVLVVDNERAIQTGMSTLLGGWGCAVATAAGFEEAVAAFADGEAPDVILVDYHLDDGETGEDRKSTRLNSSH